MPGLNAADAERLLKDIHTWSGVQAKQIFQWVGNLLYATEDLLTNGEQSPYAGYFWIRLYGVLDEIRSRHLSQLNTLNRFPRSELYRFPNARALILKFEHEYRNICDIYSIFTKEELVYIEYLRHCECHPWQDGYRLQFKRKAGKLKDSRELRLADDDFSINDIDHILTAQSQLYSHNGSRAAVAFGKRIIEPLGNLVEFMEPLYH